eukprot:CAMPEP_0169408862 /NCGR_PEP_ID=MMETSP1017-20121227/58934_1 /TAXON_ID=342587 /ORGANISM="Karlodinium micrum, Strain CCMP2283" /LENGTH=441 /DNA_ID=CAMNT_0009516009 /DNA_START=119 /DNA_END=1444 /DNA_ORIENTATION=+
MTFNAQAAEIAQTAALGTETLISPAFEDCRDGEDGTRERSRSPTREPEDDPAPTTQESKRRSKEAARPSTKSVQPRSSNTDMPADSQTLGSQAVAAQVAQTVTAQPFVPQTRKPMQQDMLQTVTAQPFVPQTRTPMQQDMLANLETVSSTSQWLSPGTLNLPFGTPSLSVTPPQMIPPGSNAVNAQATELVFTQALDTRDCLIQRLKRGDNQDECYYEVVSNLQSQVFALQHVVGALEQFVADLNSRQLPRCIMSKPKDMGPREFTAAAEVFLRSSGVKQKVLAVNKFSMPLSFWPMTSDAHGDIKEALKTYDECPKLKASFIIYDSPTKVKLQEAQDTLKKRHNLKAQQLRVVWPGPRSLKAQDQDGWTILSEDARRPMINCRYDHKEFKAIIEFDRSTFIGYGLNAKQVVADWLTFCPEYFPLQVRMTDGPLAAIGRTP